MRINKIQNNETTFYAKLRIINKDFDKKFLAQLNEKADKIGLTRDIIELKYSNLVDRKEEEIINKKKFNDKKIGKRISEVLEARFLPLGEEYGVDYSQIAIYANQYTELWEHEEKAAEKYLYNLNKKYM